jgi:hypothetical protein
MRSVEFYHVTKSLKSWEHEVFIKFCDIRNLVSFSTKLAQLVKFTLEKKILKIFLYFYLLQNATKFVGIFLKKLPVENHHVIHPFMSG